MTLQFHVGHVTAETSLPEMFPTRDGDDSFTVFFDTFHQNLRHFLTHLGRHYDTLRYLGPHFP